MSNHSVTQLVNGLCSVHTNSNSNQLWQTIYRELYKIASANRQRWSGNETISTTVLVNETYLKMEPMRGKFKNRKHFYTSAAKVMRHVLVNYAERSTADKRKPDDHDSVNMQMYQEDPVDDVLFINQLLVKVSAGNPRHRQIIECRVFAGMNIEQTANTLDISCSTVKRDWAFLSAWIYRELKPLNNRHV